MSKTTISAGQTSKIVISATLDSVCRIDGTIFFDTARSFVFSRYKPALEQAFAFGLEASPSGSWPAPSSERYLLIIGHTDQVGSTASNQKLSQRRAIATLAVFTIDADSWEELYKTEHWGDKEIIEMFGAVEIRSPSPEEFADLKSNSAKRLDLMQRYLLFLRPDWVPKVSPPISPNVVSMPPSKDPFLGCGFKHPRTNAPGVALEENRRVEFFYFRQSDPLVRQCPTPTIYRSWQATCGKFIKVQIELIDEYSDPYVGPFNLTLPTGIVLQNERTDNKGIWTRDNLPTGLYTVTIAGKSLSLMR